MPSLHLLIKGRVQGVFYRASAKDVAIEMGITGWIKNTMEGDVEALITGQQNQLDQFVAWCKKGPRRANVSAVILSACEEKSFNDFTIVRD